MVVYNFCHSPIICSYFPVLFLYVFTLQRSLSAGYYITRFTNCVCITPPYGINVIHCTINRTVLVPCGTFRVCLLPHSCVTPPYLSTASLYRTNCCQSLVHASYTISVPTLCSNNGWCTRSFRNFPCVSLPHKGSMCHTHVR